MDPYRRPLPYGHGHGVGGGLPPGSTVKTMTTGVPLSARFQQIQLSQGYSQSQPQSQHQFPPQPQFPAQPQRSIGYGGNYYAGPPEFQVVPNSDYAQRAATASAARNRMMAKQIAQRRAVLEMQQLRRLTGVGFGVAPLRRKLAVQSRIGQRGGRLLRAAMLQNQAVALLPEGQMSSFALSGGRQGGIVNRGGVFPKAPTRNRVGLTGRVGNANRTPGGVRGSRGGNMISTKSGRGDLNNRSGNQKTDLPSKEDLDSELDSYMSNCKNYLDKELDDYMASRASAASGNVTTTPSETSEAEVLMES